MKKIAFCFLIYDVINHEELWNMFFTNVDKNKYNIYIHYKTNAPLQYFDRYKLTNCIETRYENQTIPLAYNLLFQTAYESDPDNYKFVIVSGSCIPFKSFSFIYDKLTRDNYGYFNVCPQIQCFPTCNPLLAFVKREHISKSHNWFILNRTLVEKLCIGKDRILNEYYVNVYAPAEYYYYTYIKILNLEREVITTMNAASEASTFTNWQGMNYKYPCQGGLKNYSSISEQEIKHLIQSDCLFGRKFNRECILSLMNKTYIEGILIP
jgi:Core-2/I-Branching enzyme